jgi:fumarate hydratase subunit alpha
MVLTKLLENIALAPATDTPLCQDTGMAQVVIELGQAVTLTGPPLNEAVNSGVRAAYGEGYLRKSTCHPLTRQNLGDNTPASLEVLLVPGDSIQVMALSKGGGCDNKSTLSVLPPTADLKILKDHVVSLVTAAGPDSCPPLCLGLAIGGSFESAPRLARRALIDLWESEPMTEEEESLSEGILTQINQTGLGPLGLGGRTTALGLRIKIYPTHLASLPIALCVNCHSMRTGRAVI